MNGERIKGIEVDSQSPRSLVLSDGTTLSLDTETWEHGHVEWTRRPLNGTDDTDELSVADALRLAGEEYSGYVKVRTRAEIEWLRVVAEWYAHQADHLSRDLELATH